MRRFMIMTLFTLCGLWPAVAAADGCSNGVAPEPMFAYPPLAGPELLTPVASPTEPTHENAINNNQEQDVVVIELPASLESSTVDRRAVSPRDTIVVRESKVAKKQSEESVSKIDTLIDNSANWQPAFHASKFEFESFDSSDVEFESASFSIDPSAQLAFEAKTESSHFEVQSDSDNGLFVSSDSLETVEANRVDAAAEGAAVVTQTIERDGSATIAVSNQENDAAASEREHSATGATAAIGATTTRSSKTTTQSRKASTGQRVVRRRTARTQQRGSSWNQWRWGLLPLALLPFGWFALNQRKWVAAEEDSYNDTTTHTIATTRTQSRSGVAVVSDRDASIATRQSAKSEFRGEGAARRSSAKIDIATSATQSCSSVSAFSDRDDDTTTRRRSRKSKIQCEEASRRNSAERDIAGTETQSCSGGAAFSDRDEDAAVREPKKSECGGGCGSANIAGVADAKSGSELGRKAGFDSQAYSTGKTSARRTLSNDVSADPGEFEGRILTNGVWEKAVAPTRSSVEAQDASYKLVRADDFDYEDLDGMEILLSELQETRAEMGNYHCETNPASSLIGQGRDDLTKIHGIGPATVRLLARHGICSFAELAATNQDDLDVLIQRAGNRFQQSDPQSWLEQAALAAKNQWDELERLNS